MILLTPNIRLSYYARAMWQHPAEICGCACWEPFQQQCSVYWVAHEASRPSLTSMMPRALYWKHPTSSCMYWLPAASTICCENSTNTRAILVKVFWRHMTHYWVFIMFLWRKSMEIQQCTVIYKLCADPGSSPNNTKHSLISFPFETRVVSLLPAWLAVCPLYQQSLILWRQSFPVY